MEEGAVQTKCRGDDAKVIFGQNGSWMFSISYSRLFLSTYSNIRRAHGLSSC